MKRRLFRLLTRLLLLGVLGTAALFVIPPLFPLSEVPKRYRGSVSYVDVHCHVAGVGAGQSGIFLSPQMLQSFKK